MSESPNFDLPSAHRYFSAACFNQAWDLIDKTPRTPQEDEQMLALSCASAWHWSQRQDVSATSRSVGYWQISRIYALLNQPENASRYGQLCLDYSLEDGVGPFYQAYAQEALARAARTAGDQAGLREHLLEAQRLAAKVKHKADRDVLLKDLASLVD